MDLARTQTIALTLPVRGFATNILVTPARGAKESTFDVPAAVSVTTRREMDARAFHLLPQVLREEPGVLVQQTTTAQASPIVRGFTGQSNVYLIDSVRFNTASWRGGPSQYLSWIGSGMASRVEVVRGPGSVEYGSDALGGTINVLTDRPVFSFGGTRTTGEVQLNVGSADQSAGGQGQVTVQGRSVAFRIGASTARVRNLRSGRGIDSHAAVTRFLGVPSNVMYARMPGTGFEQSGAFLIGELRAGPQATISTVYLHENQTGASRYDRLEGGEGLYRSGFSPQRLDFGVVRYQRRSMRAFDELSISVSMNRQGDGRYEQARPTAVIDQQSGVTTVIGYQVEANRQLAGRHRMGLGAEVYDESTEASRVQVNARTGVATPNRPDIPDGTQYNNAGVFVNDMFDVVPGRFRLRGGLRYGRFGFSTTADPLLGVAAERITTGALTFNAGAVVTLTSRVNATFNIGRGFRAPNAADFGSIGLTGGGGLEVAPSRAAAMGGVVGTTGAAGAVSTGEAVPPLGPEVVYSFEPGLKFRSTRFSASIAGYDIEYLDSIQRRAIVFDTNVEGMSLAGFQVVRQDANGLAYIAQDIRPIATRVNADHARIRGFDADATASFGERWRARTFFSMTNGRLLATGEYLRRMPPPLGGGSLRWSAPRVWIEATTMFAGAQSRFNIGDLTDARIGGMRTRGSIATYFNGTATDIGLVRDGILQPTGETLSQVQGRLLGDAASAPLFDRASGFFIVGLRGGVNVSRDVDLTVIGENLTDRNYRVYGSGVDGPGVNVQARVRYRF